MILYQSMTSALLARSSISRPLLLLALLVLVAIAWSQSGGIASAHAALVRSDPPVNARLSDSPTQVTAFSSESLDSQLSSLPVLNVHGQRFNPDYTTSGRDPAQMPISGDQSGPGLWSVT